MNKKYIVWLIAVIIWNYGFPNVSPIYDVIMALLLKHMFDIVNYFTIKLV